MSKRVHSRLRAARVLQGLTQTDLAKRIGRSMAYVGRLESYVVKPSDLEASIIARALRVDPNYLFPKEPQATDELRVLERAEA